MPAKKDNKKSTLDPQIKELIKIQGEETCRYMGALKEDFQSRIEVIAEQYTDIKQTLGAHTSDIKGIKQTLDSHTEMIGQVLVEIDDIKDGLKQKVDYADFAKLEKRVRALEVKH